MRRQWLSQLSSLILLAPLYSWAGPLTFTVRSEIDVDVGAPLQGTDEVWCHVWLRTGPTTADFELTHIKASPLDGNRYVCKPSIFFRWGRADAYKTSGAHIVYGADVLKSRQTQGRPNRAGGERQITALGPSLYPPPAPKTVMELPVVTLHL
jgi:hypothetical protein